ncbi:MAG: GNAT family N-acetyltransferase [Gemmataceae bacterium]|nr:GNAT family N-acetyltransferase [Gemmataceae bacterium]
MPPFVGTAKDSSTAPTPTASCGDQPTNGQGAANRPWVEVIDDPARLAGYIDAWTELAAHAIEPNIFYEPWFVLPALRTLVPVPRNLLFLLVFVPDSDPARPPRLTAFVPLERRRRYKRLPVSYLRLWSHEHSYLYSPLIHKDHAPESLDAVFDWLDHDRRSRPLVEWPLCLAEGPLYRQLVDLFGRRGTLTYAADQVTRAYCRPGADADAYLNAALSSNKRRDLNRRQRKLAEQGQVEFRVLQTSDEIAAGCEDFLRLESGGWKGRTGTALAATPAGQEFFRAVVREAGARGQLLLHGLYLNGRPIAMRTTFTSGAGSFFFKPAYDEAFAAYSPGVLLELETIRLLHGHPTVRWMDSCTSPGNELLNQLWLDRVAVQTLVTATEHGLGRLTVSLLPLLRWLKRKLGRHRGNSFRD